MADDRRSTDGAENLSDGAQGRADEAAAGRPRRRARLGGLGGQSQLLAAWADAAAAAAGLRLRPRRASSAAPAPVIGDTLTGVIPPSITDVDPVTRIYDRRHRPHPGRSRVPHRARQRRRPRPSLAEADRQRRRLRVDVQTRRASRQRRQPVRGRRRGRDHGPRRQSQGRLRRPRRSPGHPLAGGAKEVDAATVEFTLTSSFAELPIPWCGSVLPKHSSCSAHLCRRFRQEPRQHRPLHAGRPTTPRRRTVMVKNPHVLGKDAARQRVPYLDRHLGHGPGRGPRRPGLGSGAVDFRRRPSSRALSDVRRPELLRVDVYPGAGIPRSPSTLTRTSKSAPRSRAAVAYASTARPSTSSVDGRSDLGYNTFGSDGLPRQPHAPRVRAQVTRRPPSARRRRSRHGIEDRADGRQPLESRGWPSRPAAAASLPAHRQDQPDQLRCDLRRRRDRHPSLNAPMVMVEWGSRPTQGMFAQAMLMPGAA